MGDRDSDKQAAINAGCNFILINPKFDLSLATKKIIENSK